MVLGPSEPDRRVAGFADSDDAAAFEAKKREDAARMAGDAELQERARDVLTRADRHNWSYQWSWLGRPIIQMPEDIVLLQEILWQTRPTLVIETGVARGGSVIFLASILELIGEGRVIGIEIDLRSHNREAILAHKLAPRIEIVDGSSVAEEVWGKVRAKISGSDRVMVILDSDHTHEHVYRELQLYAPLVTRDQFLVVSDTVVEDIPVQEHRPRPWGPGNNPSTALDAYLRESHAFARDPYFNGKLLLTSAPRGYLRRVR
jgi:cephalosporin hydroxylase